MSLMKDIENRLVWIDCEMTGLDYTKDVIVEIAVIITDKFLNEVAVGPELVIYQPPEVLETMSDWCKTTFAENGLLERIKESRVTMKDAESQIYEFIKKHTIPGKSVIAGNTVQMDRCFLRKDMPSVDQHLHYRCVDVSTIKELTWRWYRNFKFVPKKATHRALDDIRESIEELRDYKKRVFVTPLNR